MATLVQRLMHDPSVPPADHIAVHDFFAALTRVNAGRWTAADIKSYYGMSGQDGTDFDWMVAQLAAISDQTQRLAVLTEINAVFILAESGTIPNHITPNDVQTEIVNLLT